MNYTKYLLIYKEVVQQCNTLVIVLSYFVYIISRLCSRKYNLDVFLNLFIDTLTSIFFCKAFQIRRLLFIKFLA